MNTATNREPARRGRPMEETVIERKGRSMGERPVSGFRITRVPREFVRRTITIDLETDRLLRDKIDREGGSYSATVEKVLRAYVGQPPEQD